MARPPRQSPNLAVRTCVGVRRSVCGCSSGVLLPGSDSAGSNIKTNQNRTATSKQSKQKQTRGCTSTSLFQLQALSLRLRHTGKHVQPEQKGAGSTWRQRNRKEAEASCIRRLFTCCCLVLQYDVIGRALTASNVGSRALHPVPSDHLCRKLKVPYEFQYES